MNILLIIWFSLTALSLIYVIWHNLYHNPVSWVQKLAWILVTVYAGPISLLAYWFTCRTRKGLSHDASTQETWQQAVNSEMHCLAGDATGIIISASIVYWFGFPNGIDLIIEYLSAFIVGLLIFQALMMKDMYGGDYGLAVKKTFFVETVSMNTVMVGMIPVMIVLMHLFPEGDNPLEPNFWFVMAMATITGGITAYPINYWLVAKKLKHGCMTIPTPGTKEHHTMTHQMGKISRRRQWGWIITTFVLLIVIVIITGYFLPIQF